MVSSSCAGDAADALTLQGFRKFAAIALVENMLKNLSMAHTPDALEKWPDADCFEIR